MRSPKGAALVLLGALVFVPWLLSAALTQPATSERLEEIRRWGPLALLAFALINLLFSVGEGAVSFNAAEVTLLFPGPFTRRQLLLYKIVGIVGGAVFSAAILTVFLRQHTAWWVAAFVGFSLTLLFLQLLTIALALISSTIGASIYNRQRQLVLLLLIALVGVGLYQVGLENLGGGWQELLAKLERAPVVQAVLTPVGWFVQAVTAERAWPDLAKWCGLALGMDLILVAVILFLDAHYLETSAAASERVYARLQRIRQGGTAAASLPGSGTARLVAPPLPWWGGVGPLAWRQLTTALRSWRALLSLLILFALMTAPMLAGSRGLNEVGTPFPLFGTLLVMLALFVPPLIPFDFRGDIDRMELLKTLPVASWRLVIGQLLTPIVLLTLLQMAAVIVVRQVWGQFEGYVLVALALLVPFNFLVFGLENLLFLWFPSRMVSAGPGDFHMLGRQLVLWMAKLLGLAAAFVPVTLVGLLVYLLTGNNWVAAGVSAWVTLVGFVIGLVPLIALAFRHYDVARDTPP
jgi:hypothetical protein